MSEKIKVQLTRLKKHYETFVQTYDKVSLLDFAHALRVWTEMTESLSQTINGFDSKIYFKSARKVQKLSHQKNGSAKTKGQ